MRHDEIVNLIRDGFTNIQSGGVWADFGAGRGNFTRALTELLDDSATIYALDRDEYVLESHDAHIKTIHADFTKSPDLPSLDGILMANALHFVMRQERMVQRIHNYLKPHGRFIIVEYDRRLPWTPFPVTFTHFESLATKAGFEHVRQIGTRISPSNGVGMYAAVASLIHF